MIPATTGPRRVTGMAAVLLPYRGDGTIDWPAFEAHVARTAAAGLVAAVNMDTGYVQLLGDDDRRRALEIAADVCPGDFVAGAYVADEPGASFDLDGYRRAAARHLRAGRHARRLPVARPQRARRRGLGRRARAVRAGGRPLHRVRAGSDVRPVRPHRRHRRVPRPARDPARASAPSTRRSAASAEWERLAAPRRGAPRVPGAHRERPGHRHGHVGLGLPARPGDVRARGVRPPRRVLGQRRPAVLRAERRPPVPRRLRVPRPGPGVPPRRRDVPRAARLGEQRRDTARGAPPPDVGPRRAGRHRRAAGGAREAAAGQVPRHAGRRSPSTSRGSASRSPVDSRSMARSIRPAPLADAADIHDRAGDLRVPNRFAALPMEGWDGTVDGRPTDLVRRRWSRIGAQRLRARVGRGDGGPPRRAGQPEPARARRAAPSRTSPASAASSPRRPGGRAPAHPLRTVRPPGRRASTAHRVPRTRSSTSASGAAEAALLSDGELDELAGRYVDAAVLAPQAGFDFVDIKHCHGYLLHELLTAYDRPGRYGGDLAGRTRFLRTVVAGIRDAGTRARDRRAPVAVRRRALRRGRGRRRDAGGRGRRTATPSAATAPAAGSTSPRPTSCSRCSSPLGIGLVAIDRRQPVLLPPRPAAGLLPAVGRLRAAGGSARRRRPPARRDRRGDPPPPATSRSSAPATPTSRTGCRTSARPSSPPAART